MKKILVLLLVALVAVALVACGGDAPTTTKGGNDATAGKPEVTTVPGADTTVPGADTTVPGTDTTVPGETSKTPNTPETPGTTDKGPFGGGIDILNGEPGFMAINPTWKGLYGCAFENHHAELDYRWCFVFNILPTEEFVMEELILLDDEVGYGVVLEDYDWTLYINGEDVPINSFLVPMGSVTNAGLTYVRIDLGEWAPELGEHEYDIKLKITEAGSDEVLYWAWFSDPEWCGSYVYNRAPDIEVIPTDEVPEDVEALPTGSLTGISGPESLAATETYVKLFDGLAKTKFCSGDYTVPLIFTVADASDLRGISLVGANDDERFPERIPVKFKLYGSDDGTEGSWNLVLDVNKTVDDVTVTNYLEHYYAFGESVDYGYFKIEIEDASGAETPKYQYSEIILYTSKK